MLKINLSDREGKKEKKQEATNTVSRSTVEISEHTMAEEITESSGKSATSSRYLIILLVVAVGAAVYFQKDFLFSFLPGKAPEVEVVTPPPAPPPEPVKAPKEPDPTFIVLGRISEILPQRVWLSTAVIRYDGTYEIKGIAFTHSAMISLVDALGSIGDITEKKIPDKSKSSETVYNFSLGGAINVANVPEILDIIPTDDLVTLAVPVVERSKDLNVAFSKTPRSGEVFSDKDLPFALEGSYEGLKKVIAELCPADENFRIFQIVILPAAPGRTFDKVKASFSLRTISMI